MNLKTQFTRFTLAAGTLLLAGGTFAQQNTVHGPREQGSQTMSAVTTQTLHKTVQVDGVEIFYREAVLAQPVNATLGLSRSTEMS